MTLRDKIEDVIFDKIYENCGYVCGRDEAADAILDVIREGVKPLEFEHVSGKVYDANGCGVLYRIVGSWDGTSWGVRVAQTRNNDFEFDTYEDAAEHCRTLVGHRILSALNL